VPIPRPDEREYLRTAACPARGARYAVNEEASSYLAIMRTFTGEVSGLLSDQSAAEVAQRLAGQGFALDVDTVDARLSYLVEHGSLARSRADRGAQPARVPAEPCSVPAHPTRELVQQRRGAARAHGSGT
jgi:hypothetical protein